MSSSLEAMQMLAFCSWTSRTVSKNKLVFINYPVSGILLQNTEQTEMVAKIWIRACGVAQVVEHLPGKCEALSSNPLSPKKKKKDN
jgi:hypothetical protein